MTRKLVLLLVALSASATSSFADWGRDDTALLAKHIKECLAGTRTTLEPITYYVRGQIRVGKPDSNSPINASKSLYFVPWPDGTGALTIKGADPIANSSTGTQYSIPARLRTRIVHGVAVGGTSTRHSVPWDLSSETEGSPIDCTSEIHSGVPTDDPWHGRFPSSVQICWVQFNEGSPGTGQERSRYDSLGSWAFDPIKAHKYLDFSTALPRHWPTVTYQGVPLKYAEPVRGTNPDDPTYRWTRVDGGTQTLWEQSTISPYTGTQSYPGLFNVPSGNHENDWTWGITFHDWDADCAMARVAFIEREQYSTGPVGGPLETTHRYVGVTFMQNPFGAVLGGMATLPNKKQRFTLMNAPEFLDEPGEMVFNPSNGRIYFVCPNMSGTTLPDTEANKLIEVAWPTGPDASTNWGMPITIGDDTVDTTRQLTIENVMVGTGRGVGVKVDRMNGVSLSNPVYFYHCKFRNQGFQGLSLSRCRNVKIKECEFEDGLRGHLKIDAGRDFTHEYNHANAPSIDAVRTLTSDNIQVYSCIFATGGVMWPYNGVLEMTGWNIGTRVYGCYFSDLSGIAVRIHGAQNIVEGNTFEDCVKDVTDYGAIYVGRSLVQIGNVIHQNLIQGVKWRGRATQERVDGSLEDDVCGIYCDDYICGTSVTFNDLIDCQTGIESNGGRFNLFRRNHFDTSVEYPFRTNVIRQAPGAFGTIGSFRYYDSNEDYYKHSLANQLYTEMRNLYIACKTVNGTYDAGFNVFATSSAWQTAQSTGAYDTGYASVDTSSRKDLEHLVARLNDATTGQPTWDDAYSESLPYKDASKNSLRRIQYSNAGDWFETATSTLVSGTGNRKWLDEYTGGYGSKTVLRNYFNLFRWNDCDFGDPSKNPAYGLPSNNPFFRSYRSWWSSASDNYMTGDTTGYEATEVPCEAWE